MTAFIWIMLAVVIFVGGQILAMRPNARDQALLTLRETARKTGLQPRLLVAPEWLKQDSRQMVACYTLIVPEAVVSARQELEQRTLFGMQIAIQVVGLILLLLLILMLAIPV